MKNGVDTAALRSDGSRVGDVLAAGSLPPLVARLLLDDRRWRPDAIRNRWLAGELLADLYRKSAPALEAETIIACATDPAIVDTVLSSGDSRDRPLRRLLADWQLSVAQQRALVALPLSETLAGEILTTRASVCLDVRAGLLGRTSWASALTWLTEPPAAGVADEAAWDLLERIAERHSNDSAFEGELPHLLARILRDRPSLVPAALDSEAPELVAAACASCLEPSSQERALEQIAAHCTGRLYLDFGWATALVNLLDHPATKTTVRVAGWEFAATGALARYLAEQAVPSATSMLAAGTPLQLIEDPALLELVCLRDPSPFYGSGRLQQWIELTQNPHVGALEARRLTAHLDRCAAFSARRHLSHSALRDVAAMCTRTGIALPPGLRDALDAASMAERMLELNRDAHERAGSCVVAQRLRSAPEPGAAEHADPGARVVGDRDRAWSRLVPHQAAWLVQELGEEPAAWEVALSLCDDFDGSFAALVESAMALSRADS